MVNLECRYKGRTGYSLLRAIQLSADPSASDVKLHSLSVSFVLLVFTVTYWYYNTA